MISVSRHAKIRYCERVLKMPETEAKPYIQHNDAQVTEAIRALYDKASLLWTGQFFDKDISNHWINGDLIIITDIRDEVMITMFHPDFGFPAEVNQITLRSLLAEKQKVDRKAKKAAEVVEKRTDPARLELVAIEEQIDNLNRQVEILQSRWKALTAEIETANYEVNIYTNESDRIAKMICNSVELKEDILSFRNGNGKVS